MATISKQSSLTSATLLVCAFCFLILASSCKGEQEGNGEWIPTPPDSSSLGKIDHFIPVGRMDEFKKQYTVDRDSVMRCIPGLFIPESEAFNKEWLLKVLKDPKCVGIRIYYGVRAKAGDRNEFRLMIVGVDEQGQDLYITRGSTLAGQGGDEGKGGLEWGQCNPPCIPQP
jgi:hypothetical protein